MIEAEQLKPGKTRKADPSGVGTAFARFLIWRQEPTKKVTGTTAKGKEVKDTAKPKSRFTNEELATFLGYARPNIVSSWKSGKTKFTLENVLPLAEFLKVDPAYMLAMYVEQYAKTGQDVDCFPEIVKMMGHICTEEEWELISLIREARRGNKLNLDARKKRELIDMFMAQPDEPDGPYWPIKQIIPTETSDFTPTKRRGLSHEEYSVTMEEEADAVKEAKRTETQGEVLLRSAAAKD